MILEVVTAVAELQAGMVAVAGLVAEVLDDGIDGRLLDDAGRVASGAAELRLPTGAARDAGQWHAAGQEEHGPERHWHRWLRLRHLDSGSFSYSTGCFGDSGLNDISGVQSVCHTHPATH